MRIFLSPCGALADFELDVSGFAENVSVASGEWVLRGALEHSLLTGSRREKNPFS
jgi:hypothetical protein